MEDKIPAASMLSPQTIRRHMPELSKELGLEYMGPNWVQHHCDGHRLQVRIFGWWRTILFIPNKGNSTHYHYALGKRLRVAITRNEKADW